MTVAIWWIRRDLRLTDNRALTAALGAADQVVPVFLWDATILGSPWYGEKRHAFLLGGLRALAASLQGRGSRLILRQGDPAAELQKVCAEAGASTVFAERDYSPYAKRRDEAVASVVNLSLHEGVTIRPLDAVRQESGKDYTVFTPYSKRWKSLPPVQRSDILPAPKTIPTPANLASLPWPDQPTLPASVPFLPSEEEAKRRLGAFVEGADAPIYHYGSGRDRPDLAATSQLSPYLRFGMVSARLAALGAYTAMERAADKAARASVEIWLNELIWRDFYLMILNEYPHVRRGSFRRQYDRIAWVNDEQHFAAWCEGRTGYPIVDAAMRQLATLGWMHNRLRMITASFLVKDLLIDWRWGERWFMQSLIDGDPAANNGGWQWTAGVGTDAAPYFRVFNPTSQGEKFDPEGAFVRQWVPELAGTPVKYIHAPWTMPPSEQRRARCLIGQEYPAPIIDHAWARERALAAYKVA